MRQSYKLAAPVGRAVTIPFQPDYVLVVNPTPYTLYMRVGANDIPDTLASADEYVSPTSFRSFPIDRGGMAYGFGFGVPQISFSPESLPATRADVTFYAGELAPQIGSLPLTNSGIVPSDTLAYDGATPPGGIVVLPVPSDAKGFVLVIPNINVLSAIQVEGVTTGNRYLEIDATDYATRARFAVAIQGGRESAIQVTWGNGSALIGPSLFFTRDAPGEYGDKGAALVVTAARPLPVRGVSDLANPLADVYSGLTGAAALAVVVNTAALAAGSYRVEAEIMCDQSPAAPGTFAYLSHEAGLGGLNRRVVMVAAPGHMAVVWSRVAVQTGDVFVIHNGGNALAAAARVAGAIRAYKLA